MCRTIVMEQKYLEQLNQLLEKSNRTAPPWLQDLLLHGPRLELWSPPEKRPNRVLLTEFLARWLKFAGLSREECLDWLLPYCCEVLAQYSKSGMSNIRHGTKANTRWVYASPFPFDFETMVLDLPATESQGPLLYAPVVERWKQQLEEMKIKARESYVPPVFEPFVPVKVRFAEQFKRALEFAQQKRAEGERPEAILRLLNEQGFLTRTGRKWTLGTVNRELGRRSA